jgi:hypothetical protein
MHDDDLYGEGDLQESEDPGADDEIELVPCPYCRRMIYEEAEQCPSCRSYISREDAPLRRTSWFTMGVLLCLGIVVVWIVGC